MEAWTVTPCPTDEGDYILQNRSRTLIRLSTRANVDVARVLSEIEELGVPFSYTDKLKEIYFTILPSSETHVFHGDHKDGKIRVSVASEARELLVRTLVHELAHDIDDHEGISDSDEIIREKRKCARLLPDPHARKSVGEYVAIGFETYYCGTRAERSTLRLCCPRLHAAVRRVHRKYRSR